MSQTVTLNFGETKTTFTFPNLPRIGDHFIFDAALSVKFDPKYKRDKYTVHSVVFTQWNNSYTIYLTQGHV